MPKQAGAIDAMRKGCCTFYSVGLRVPEGFEQGITVAKMEVTS